MVACVEERPREVGDLTFPFLRNGGSFSKGVAIHILRQVQRWSKEGFREKAGAMCQRPIVTLFYFKNQTHLCLQVWEQRTHLVGESRSKLSSGPSAAGAVGPGFRGGFLLSQFEGVPRGRHSMGCSHGGGSAFPEEGLNCIFLFVFITGILHDIFFLVLQHTATIT